MNVLGSGEIPASGLLFASYIYTCRVNNETSEHTFSCFFLPFFFFYLFIAFLGIGEQQAQDA